MWIEDQDGAWHNSKYIMNLEIIGDLFESSILATDINNNIIESIIYQSFQWQNP